MGDVAISGRLAGTTLNNGIETLQRVTVDSAGYIGIGADYRGVYPEAWYLEFTGVAGVSDNDVIYTSPDVSGYNVHYIECTAGTIDVDVSLNGTNWIAAVAGVSLVTTTPGTRVIDAASGVCLEIQGKFKRIRVLQKGATASNARGAHGVI
jgi:hypothetical protein